MKKIYYIILFLLVPFVMNAQEPTTTQTENSNPQIPQKDKEQEQNSDKGRSVFIGAVKVDGLNYQQIGIKGDIPIGKFGFGVDINLLIDQDGNIRKEDWNNWTDYLDKIYYIRWAHKGDPFYFKFGGLNYSYIGYKGIINGYSNMLEYPTYKRYGLELSIQTGKFGMELFTNNFKELFRKNASIVAGVRMAYKVVGDLTVGATFVRDFNQYNGLRDRDEDGTPDQIDKYPYDAGFATEIEYLESSYRNSGSSQVAIDTTINTQFKNRPIEDKRRSSDLFSFNNDNPKRAVNVFGADVGYPLIHNKFIKLDVYSEFSKIQAYGWGATLPGASLSVGEFFTLSAEYRQQSKEFIFGYFNQTYEFERASFVSDPKQPFTKDMKLSLITESMSGFFVGLNVNLLGFASLSFNYSDLGGANGFHNKSMYGEASLKKKLIPGINEAKAYYVQNNVQDFREWKTPSTILGYILEYNIGGAGVGFEYRFNFKNNSSGNVETIKTILLRTSVKF